jgi:hypothetical protein
MQLFLVCASFLLGFFCFLGCNVFAPSVGALSVWCALVVSIPKRALDVDCWSAPDLQGAANPSAGHPEVAASLNTKVWRVAWTILVVSHASYSWS